MFAAPFPGSAWKAISERLLCALGEGVEPKASALYLERTPVPQSGESEDLKGPWQAWGLGSGRLGMNRYGPML